MGVGDSAGNIGGGPSAMSATDVLSKRDMADRLSRRVTRARVRFWFSVIKAMSGFESKDIHEFEERPSHTRICRYAWTRELSTCGHAPIWERKERDEGVRELARLEN